MNKKTLLIAGLLFPLFGLLLLVASKEYVVNTGKSFTLKVSGFDPRDLLSGHYIIYQIDFELDGLCTESNEAQAICLDDSGHHRWANNAQDCDYALRGYCSGSRFNTGLERFYIPQSEAARLDAAVRNGGGSIIVTIGQNGHAIVEELLINGQSWKDEKMDIHDSGE